MERDRDAFFLLGLLWDGDGEAKRQIFEFLQSLLLSIRMYGISAQHVYVQHLTPGLGLGMTSMSRSS